MTELRGTDTGAVADRGWSGPGVRVAIYTRVAGRDRHAQARLVRRHARLGAAVAARAGWWTVAAYADMDASRSGCAGLRSLVADAEHGCFDLVVVDNPAFLGPVEERSRVVARLAAAGVAIHPLVSGGGRRLRAAAISAAVVGLADLLDP